MYHDDNGSEGPRGTFEIYRAEADSLFKQGEYRKSIESYTLALELTPGEKNCLVARSKCYLQLGDMQSALNDAEASLQEDKDYHKGIFQKAQALYYQGDFEMALVFYHRGHKLRPELHEFRLGIQKGQEAIDNSVGSPDTVKLTTEGDLSYFEQMQDDKKIKRKTNTIGRTAVAQTSKTTKQRTPPGSEKTIKQLLGELYGDRQYLEKLLKETDPQSEMGKTISTLVTEGLSYLDTRSDFWRQQKPMYARRHDRLMQRRKREVSSNKVSPNDYIIKELEKIDDAHVEGRYTEALRRSEKCMATVQKFSEEDVPNKTEVIANLNSCLGNAYLELGDYGKSLASHEMDLQIGETNDLGEAVSRALDNIGRVHARKGDFSNAIQVWERKLPMSKSPLENTWLFHEIGRCHLEIGNFSEAKNYGVQSETAAVDAGDTMWHLQASVLTGQAEVKLEEYSAGAATFEKALELAKAQGDKAAESAISRAIEDLNTKIIIEQVKQAENENNINANQPPSQSPDKPASPVKSSSPVKEPAKTPVQETKPEETTKDEEPPKKEDTPKTTSRTESPAENKPTATTPSGDKAEESVEDKPVEKAEDSGDTKSQEQTGES
ncbi:outer dynein arm-docking complex subunit 4-like [Mya arenaria]|uniref:outer dynein arm-docking complex subunit 4-like n=1 Tax=Mya arenaria TaxID=6604 RepID=UPI0022E0AAF8|nr:outer dynein arm-docking complex subunit 4-like [Mya arenaria]